MNSRRYQAFTLIELIIVVTIIVLLIAILLPALGIARSQARTAKCAANLHSIGTAAQTRQAQLALSGWSKSVNLYDLVPLLNTDAKALVCPEDSVAPVFIPFDAKLACYGSSNHSGPPMYYMAIVPGNWCYRCAQDTGNYAFNFEDQRDPSDPEGAHSVGDDSFYNFYILFKAVPGGVNMTSLSSAASFDVRPPNATGGPNIYGGDTFDLVRLNGEVLRSPWNRGDPNPFFLQTGWCSYGMNSLYPSGMTSPNSDAIIVLDYLDAEASVAGPNLTPGSWGENVNPDPTKVGDRPGMARHRKRFNALFNDFTVRTNINPDVVSPEINNAVSEKWWGGKLDSTKP